MNKKLKLNVKLTGLTLIELIVTLSIISIIAWLNIKNISSQGNAKTLVDNATDIIVAQLNQAKAKSNYSFTGSGEPETVCHIAKGSGSDGRASCDNNSTTWTNVNGINFNQKVTVTVNHKATYNKKYSVVYINGSIDPSLTSGIASTSATFELTIAAVNRDKSCNSTSDTTSRNIISIWPNGVIDVTKTCDPS